MIFLAVIRLELWFDVEIESITTAYLDNMMVIKLWFDVEIG